MRAFVEKMGGAISVIPKSGNGTRMSFHLLLKRPPPALPEDAAHSALRRPVRSASHHFPGEPLPPEFEGATVLLSLPDGVVAQSIEAWLTRAGIRCSRTSSWAATALAVEEWARGTGKSGGGGSCRSGAAGKRGNSAAGRVAPRVQTPTSARKEGKEKLVVLVDVEILPGLQKLPLQMGEVKAYVGKFAYFKARGASVACVLSANTAVAVRTALREADSCVVVNKPLYASKVWRTLLSILHGLPAEDEPLTTSPGADSAEGVNSARHPLQRLHQDMLVAQGTGVHLAVEQARLDMHAHSPRAESRLSCDMRWRTEDGVADAGKEETQQTPRDTLGRLWAEHNESSGRYSARTPHPTGESWRLPVWGQALLVSGIEHGAHLAYSGGLLAEERLSASPAGGTRPSSLPLTRAGTETEKLESWVSERDHSQLMFRSEPCGIQKRLFSELCPEPGILPPPPAEYLHSPPDETSPNGGLLASFDRCRSTPADRAGHGAASSSASPAFLPFSHTKVRSSRVGPLPQSMGEGAGAAMAAGAGAALAQGGGGTSSTPSKLGDLSYSDTSTPSLNISRTPSVSGGLSAWGGSHGNTPPRPAHLSASKTAAVALELPIELPAEAPQAGRSGGSKAVDSLQFGVGRTFQAALQSALQQKLRSGELVEVVAAPAPEVPQDAPFPGGGHGQFGSVIMQSQQRPPSSSSQTFGSGLLPPLVGLEDADMPNQGSSRANASSSLNPKNPDAQEPGHERRQRSISSSAARVRSRGGSGDVPGDSLLGLSVLVAEDTPILRRLAVTMLEQLGAAVTAVVDGQEALEAVLGLAGRAKTRFDAVIMDCQVKPINLKP